MQDYYIFSYQLLYNIKKGYKYIKSDFIMRKKAIRITQFLMISIIDKDVQPVYARISFFLTIILFFFQICSSLFSCRTAGDLPNFLTRGILKKVNTMKHNDFKAIYVFNYLIGI